MDFKTAGEAVGLLGTLKEVKDKFTGKAQINALEEQFAKKDQQLGAANAGLDAFGLSSEHLAIIGISVVAIVAIIAIAAMVVRYPPAVIQA